MNEAINEKLVAMRQTLERSMVEHSDADERKALAFLKKNGYRSGKDFFIEDGEGYLPYGLYGADEEMAKQIADEMNSVGELGRVTVKREKNASKGEPDAWRLVLGK